MFIKSESRLSRPLNYISKMFAGSELKGSSSRKIGDIEIANGDGFYDNLLNSHIWEDRDIEVFVGGEGWDFADFKQVMKAKMKDVEWNDEKINIKINDKKKQFEEQIQPAKYLGTGGIEGTDDLKDTYKPLTYGRCNNVEPVLIDPANLVYQIHDGAIAGVAVCFAGIYTKENIGYTKDLANGTITLLTNPLGRVTVDVQGAAGTKYYARNTSEIIRRIVEDHSDLVWPDDFDIKSFKSVDMSSEYETGIHIRGADKSLKVILDDFMGAINGYWFFNRLNKLQIGLIGISGKVHHKDDSTISKIQRISTPIPIWSTTISYKKNYTVMNSSEIAGAASATRKSYLQVEYFQAQLANVPFVKVRHSDREHRVETNFQTKLIARKEANKRAFMFSRERNSYKIEDATIDFYMQIGDGIALNHNRFGLSNTQLFLITSIQENARTGKTILEIWG